MQTMVRLLRHRQTKGAETDRLCLRDAVTCSLLYPLFPMAVVAALDYVVGIIRQDNSANSRHLSRLPMTSRGNHSAICGRRGGRKNKSVPFSLVRGIFVPA